MKIERAVFEDLDEIVNILDEVTLKLLDEGIQQWKYPWYKENVKKELDYQYVVRKENNIIAVFSIRPLGKNNFMEEAGDRDYYLYRIAIMPEFQGKKIGEAILQYVRKLCRKDKLNIYLDCYAGNDKLRKFYKKEGFYEVGNFSEKDYNITVFRFLWKDTAAKNRLRNITKKRKRELRIIRRAAVAVLLVVLMINSKSIIGFFDHRIQMTPAIVVGEFTYWRYGEESSRKLPSYAAEIGKIEKVVSKGQWPVHSMEAVGISANMIGKQVYQSSDKNDVYIYDHNQSAYITFKKDYLIDNNNYSNGLYEKLLKACTSKKVTPLDKIPSDYTLEQARKDKLAILNYKDLKAVSEGKESWEAFLEAVDKEGKAYIRIARMGEVGQDFYIDLFYYKKNYYYFLSGNPDRYNDRYSYLLTEDLPQSENDIYTLYLLSQNNTKAVTDYLMNQATDSNVALIFFQKKEEEALQ
ncbi:Ribosomal protein S18 acetylase RimI [Anaerocolumna jejuensis DSM 15929]|uniref:Ribosomal protein S18 acetylase RimI n=1 Tax=Anaerocolumna jejuensis DSM 15929 TaxID=1121322 RepID=A0A1M6LTW6_9FIRM|nr:GNAT family N-acetyltransferase [Anaerocolumna jejuensis]SHJ74629.1 Ribosomal protein S18 acetylase RimI [Anaerocolumna jejuensis DSM 15929]